MEEFAGLLILLGIGLFITGPVAVVLVIVLFNKLGVINRRLDKLEGKHIPGVDYYKPPVPKSIVPPVVQPQPVPVPPSPQTQPPVEEKIPFKPVTPPAAPPAPSLMSAAAAPTKPSTVPPKPQAPKSAAKPVTEAISALKEFSPLKPKPAAKGGLELKIGTTVLSIVGVILVIVAVAFFLKLVYERMTFGPVARICMVATGGLFALVVGEVLRRRNYEVVAKGIAALGFVLWYAAIYGGSNLYHLFPTEWAFVMLIVVTAIAMAYAVVLNEILIAFLALLGAYLIPLIVLTGKDRILTSPNFSLLLFSYVFVLSAGAMGCAMFRRWRAVNWIAMVGTYLLYTVWFEQFYSADQMQTALFWLGLFGGMYLVLPILHGLVRKLTARSEDVTLVVVNSTAVYYYLWRMLYNGSRRDLALASAVLGVAHIAMVLVVLWRCRKDKKLQASLGVLGTAFVTAAIPMYFNTLQPTLIGWSIEAVALTFIGIRYDSLWTKIMSVIVGAVASAGLFYHLPLHVSEDFKFVFNSPFGTWIFVGLAIILCHALWRFMRFGQGEERALMSQVYFVWGRLLLATGAALEWHAHCDWHIELIPQDRAFFLMGMMVLAVILFVGFVTRPLCPKGDLVRKVGVMVMVAGSVFTAMAMMGVYYREFKLFLNVPFIFAAGFVAALYFAVWQVKRTASEDESRLQLPGALATMGMVLVLVLLSEQIYMYWYCRDYYGQTVANWQGIAFRYIFILWAVCGVIMLLAGIRFQKPGLKGLAAMTSAVSAIGLFYYLPLHTNGDFQFVFNQPFMTWVCVSVSLLVGHGLWRFMTPSKDKNGSIGSQFYYAVGLVLLGVACAMEWYAHCDWQIEPDSLGERNIYLGFVVLGGLWTLLFLARPLPPQGWLAKALGVLTAIGGAVWTVLVMTEVYHRGFMIFANVPFLIAAAFVGAVLLAAWFIKRAGDVKEGRFRLSAMLVLGALVLVWVLLSEQIYQYFWCKNQYVQAMENWRFLSQMYISVAWAIYAAVLIVLGFVFRTAGIRYLSLLIFAVLLGKINLDIWHLGTEYRIATFLTTGLILVGVSLLYQYLKNKGFFDTMEKQLQTGNGISDL